jgi:hypothetical protein
MRNIYIKELVETLRGRLLFLRSANSTFAAWIVALASNVCRYLTGHGVVGRAGVYINADAGGFTVRIMDFNRIYMC